MARRKYLFFQATKKKGNRCVDRALSCSEYNPVRTKAEAKCRSQAAADTNRGSRSPSKVWIKGLCQDQFRKETNFSKIHKHCGTRSALTSTQCNSYSQEKVAWYNTNSWKAVSVSPRIPLLTCMGGDFELTLAKRDDFKPPLWGFSPLLT